MSGVGSAPHRAPHPRDRERPRIRTRSCGFWRSRAAAQGPRQDGERTSIVTRPGVVCACYEGQRRADPPSQTPVRGGDSAHAFQRPPRPEPADPGDPRRLPREAGRGRGRLARHPLRGASRARRRAAPSRGPDGFGPRESLSVPCRPALRETDTTLRERRRPAPLAGRRARTRRAARARRPRQAGRPGTGVRALPGRRRGRARRDGSRAARLGRGPASLPGHEGDARSERSRPALDNPLPRGGPGHGPARPPRDRAGARAGAGRGGQAVLHHEARAGQDPGRGLRRPLPAARRGVDPGARARPPPPRLRGHVLRPRQGRDPPRPQARQRDGRQLRRGLRDGLGAGEGARPGRGRRAAAAEPGGARSARRGGRGLGISHPRRRRGRYPGLHVPRAGGRSHRGHGPAIGRVRARGDALPPARGPPALPQAG